MTSAPIKRLDIILAWRSKILDDVLGTWGSEDNIGKPVGADVESRKPSYPPIYALENSSEFSPLWNDAGASNEEVMAALDESGARNRCSRCRGEANRPGL